MDTRAPPFFIPKSPSEVVFASCLAEHFSIHGSPEAVGPPA